MSLLTYWLRQRDAVTNAKMSHWLLLAYELSNDTHVACFDDNNIPVEACRIDKNKPSDYVLTVLTWRTSHYVIDCADCVRLIQDYRLINWEGASR